jgi:hypothetical protein
MKKRLKQLKEWLNGFYNTWYFKHMCRKADRMHFVTGKRYWVVPFGQTKLGVVDNDMINQINKGLPKGRKIDINTLCKEAYYTTGNGTQRSRTLNKKHNV